MSYELVKEARMADPSMEGASDDDVANYLYDVDPSNKKVGSLDDYKNYLGIRKTTPEVKALMGKKVDVGNKLLQPSVFEPVLKELGTVGEMVVDALPQAGGALFSGIPSLYEIPEGKGNESAVDFLSKIRPGASEEFDLMTGAISENLGSKGVRKLFNINPKTDNLNGYISQFMKKAEEAAVHGIGSSAGESTNKKGVEEAASVGIKTGLGLTGLFGLKPRTRTKAKWELDFEANQKSAAEAKSKAAAAEAERKTTEETNRSIQEEINNAEKEGRTANAVYGGDVGITGDMFEGVPAVIRRRTDATRQMIDDMVNEVTTQKDVAQGQKRAVADNEFQSRPMAEQGDLFRDEPLYTREELFQKQKALTDVPETPLPRQPIQAIDDLRPARVESTKAPDTRTAIERMMDEFSENAGRNLQPGDYPGRAPLTNWNRAINPTTKLALTGATAAGIYALSDNPEDMAAAAMGSLGMKGRNPKLEAIRRNLPEGSKHKAEEIYAKHQGPNDPPLPSSSAPKTTNVTPESVQVNGPAFKAVTQVAGLDKLKGLYTPDIKPYKSMKSEFLAETPVKEGNKLGQASKWLVAGGEMHAAMIPNKLMRWGTELVVRGMREADAMKHEIIGPVKTQLEKLRKNALTDIVTTIIHNEGKIFTPEELKAMGRSDKQIKAYDAFVRATERVNDVINAGRAAVGKQPIKSVVGYFPHIFGGDYRTLIKDKQGNVLWAISETSPARLREAIQHLKERVGNDRGIDWDAAIPEHVKLSAYTKGNVDALAGMHEILMALEENPLAGEIKTVMQDYMNKQQYRSKGIHPHFKGRSGVEVPVEGGTAAGAQGYMGNKPWLSKEQNAREGIGAALRYYEKVMEWKGLQNAGREINKALSDPEMQRHNPEGLRLVKLQLDAYTGRQAARDHIILKALYNKTALAATGELGNVARGLMFGSNAIFHAVQALQVLQSLPGHIAQTAVLSGDTLAVMRGVGKAIADIPWMLGKEPVTAVGKEAAKFSEKYRVVEPHFFDELRSLVRSKPTQYVDLALSPFLSMVDKASRRAANITMSHVFHEVGLRGDEVGHAAAKATDLSMVNYRPQERARIVRELGVLGNLVGALHTYAMNQYNAPIMLKRNSGMIPFATHVGLTAAFGGILGFYGFNEASKIWNMVRPILQKWTGDYYPSMEELVIKEFPEMASHGIPSALTGLDLHNQFSAARYLPDDLLGSMAYVAPVVTTGQNILELLNTPTKSQAYRALGALPGPIPKALAGEHFTDSSGMIKNPKTDYGIHKRDTWERISPFLGAKSMKEAHARERHNQEMEKEQARRDGIKNATQLRRDGSNMSLQRHLDAGGTARSYVEGLKNDAIGGSLDAETNDLLANRKKRFFQMNPR